MFSRKFYEALEFFVQNVPKAAFIFVFQVYPEIQTPGAFCKCVQSDRSATFAPPFQNSGFCENNVKVRGVEEREVHLFYIYLLHNTFVALGNAFSSDLKGVNVKNSLIFLL